MVGGRLGCLMAAAPYLPGRLIEPSHRAGWRRGAGRPRACMVQIRQHTRAVVHTQHCAYRQRRTTGPSSNCQSPTAVGWCRRPRPLVERCRNQSHHGQDASVFVVLMSDELALGTEQLVFGAYVPAHMSDAERHMSDALSHMSDAERQMSDALSHMSDALSHMSDAMRLQRYLDGFSRFVPLCATCRSPRLRRTSTIWAVSLIRSLDCMLLPRARRMARASTAAGRHICLVTGAPSGRPSGTLRP